jgi:hypothetical protein
MGHQQFSRGYPDTTSLTNRFNGIRLTRGVRSLAKCKIENCFYQKFSNLRSDRFPDPNPTLFFLIEAVGFRNTLGPSENL